MWNIVIGYFRCQYWTNIYKIVIEAIWNSLRISDHSIIMHEFFINFLTFFSVYDLFDDGPHFTEIIFIWDDFWMMILFSSFFRIEERLFL